MATGYEEVITDFMRDFSRDAVVHDHKEWQTPRDAAKALIEKLTEEGWRFR